MKATLYTLPSRNVLVMEDDNGNVKIEYPVTETRGHQIAQDNKHEHITIKDGIEGLLTAQQNKKPKPITL